MSADPLHRASVDLVELKAAFAASLAREQVLTDFHRDASAANRRRLAEWAAGAIAAEKKSRAALVAKHDAAAALRARELSTAAGWN